MTKIPDTAIPKDWALPIDLEDAHRESHLRTPSDSPIIALTIADTTRDSHPLTLVEPHRRPWWRRLFNL